MPATANEPAAAPPARRWQRAAVAVLWLGLAAAMVRLAWLGDDAFITFRSVDNLLQGFGPRWNVQDRVQTFTHPAWFGLLCALQAVAGQLPLPTMALGIVLSLAAVGWLLRVCPDAGARLVLLLALLACRGWLDYTTSGLENPLFYLLLAALVAAWRQGDPARRATGVLLATGWLGCTRLDLLLLALPPCAVALRAVPWRARLRATVLGLAPLVAWTLFATVYYGSPFPITAYAKAFAPGVPAGELFAKGAYYLWAHVGEDPGMVAVIGLGLAAALWRRGDRALVFGVLLHLAYVVKVGGDYMLGRFLTPAATLAAVLLATHAARAGRRALLAAAVAVVAAGAARGLPCYLRPVAADLQQTLQKRADGLSDERTYYFAFSGLFSPHRGTLLPLVAGLDSAGLRRAGDPAPRVEVIGSVGYAAWRAGDLVHIVDPWLLDPLLMRLPVGDLHDWRIGHFYRRVPAGYLESIATGTNRIEHPGLARYWDAVRSATRDPLFAAERWRNLFALWTGALDAGLAEFTATDYRQPPRSVVPLAALAAVPAPGTPWFRHAPARSCANGGLAVRLPAPTAAAAFVLHLGGTATYEVELRRAGASVHTERLYVAAPAQDGLQPCRVAVPAAVGPIDELWLSSPAPVALPVAPCLGAVVVEDR
ncbi:MAG: hypothetical protein JNL08_03880 [Planctomycetes bacterium]|nr:hypothetical protein [Planctomycetota bacterium]